MTFFKIEILSKTLHILHRDGIDIEIFLNYLRLFVAVGPEEARVLVVM